jgi:hypothetical protein
MLKLIDYSGGYLAPQHQMSLIKLDFPARIKFADIKSMRSLILVVDDTHLGFGGF